MAYIFDLDAEVPAEPFVDPWRTEICEFALGYDVDRNVAIIMSVMLYSGTKASHVKGVAGVFDLRFGIRERDLDHEWKCTPPDYSKEAADRFIPREHRQEVRERLYAAIEVLLSHSKAKHVTMQSYYCWLQDNALWKYSCICMIIMSLGYSLVDAFRDGTNGKNYWLLSRFGVKDR
jgi:hypothetical protein